MSKSTTNLMLYSEETINDELPDVALEVAAGKCWEVGKSLYHCLLLRTGYLPLASPDRLGSVITRLICLADWASPIVFCTGRLK
jgi:hypothetical protein